uniref:Uncharacterized protein n=1 Tax=Arundo donax TaxID=35708 RepID=A0A0A8ZU06_ARUDO
MRFSVIFGCVLILLCYAAGISSVCCWYLKCKKLCVCVFPQLLYSCGTVL